MELAAGIQRVDQHTSDDLVVQDHHVVTASVLEPFISRGKDRPCVVGRTASPVGS